jgi:hypothetical protein
LGTTARTQASLGQLDLATLIGDGRFVPQKRGGCVGNTKSGKGSKVMLLTDAEGTPLGVDVESASPHEVKLIERLLEKCRDKRRKRCRLLYDRAADSEPLRTRLKQRGVRLIAPYRRFKESACEKAEPIGNEALRHSLESGTHLRLVEVSAAIGDALGVSCFFV